MAVFADLNRYVLEADEVDVVAVMRRLAGGELTETELAEWVCSHFADEGGK